MKSKVLVVGTIAFDIIFPISGDIRNEIPLKNGKLRKVNMTFLARKSNYYFGGTAANISYGLGLLGVKPLMFSAVGEDFDNEFRSHLESYGVICKPIIGPKKSETAKCFQISDDLHQQITIFQANYYGERVDDMSLSETIDSNTLKGCEVAIFAPGNNVSTINNMVEFTRVNKDPLVIFDPGMNVTTFSKEDIIEASSLSSILISNDVEISRIRKYHGLSIKELIDIGVQYVIETKGEEGSVVYSKKGEVNIPIEKPRKVVETTGAGDAYRAGLIEGLLEKLPIEKACIKGAFLAARCVEEYGGQGYKI